MKSKGFTLLECLLSLWVLAICLLLISGIVKHLAPVNQQIMARKDQEWHVFLFQLERELTDVTDVSFEKIGAAIRFTVSFENGEQKIGQWKIHTQEAA